MSNLNRATPEQALGSPENFNAGRDPVREAWYLIHNYGGDALGQLRTALAENDDVIDREKYKQKLWEKIREAFNSGVAFISPGGLYTPVRETSNEELVKDAKVAGLHEFAAMLGIVTSESITQALQLVEERLKTEGKTPSGLTFDTGVVTEVGDDLVLTWQLIGTDNALSPIALKLALETKEDYVKGSYVASVANAMKQPDLDLHIPETLKLKTLDPDALAQLGRTVLNPTRPKTTEHIWTAPLPDDRSPGAKAGEWLAKLEQRLPDAFKAAVDAFKQALSD